jgi:hypothetical protein
MTNEQLKLAADLRELHAHSTPGKWQKGATTHETVSKLSEGGYPYRIAEFRHADDAAFCDAVHEHLPTILAALAAPPAGISPAPLAGSEWISIDERLPEHEAEVLVTGFEGNDPSKPRWTQIAHFHKEGSFYDHDTGEAFYPPTHWQPLPAAPRAALSQGDVSGEGEGS